MRYLVSESRDTSSDSSLSLAFYTAPGASKPKKKSYNNDKKVSDITQTLKLTLPAHSATHQPSPTLSNSRLPCTGIALSSFKQQWISTSILPHSDIKANLTEQEGLEYVTPPTHSSKELSPPFEPSLEFKGQQPTAGTVWSAFP